MLGWKYSSATWSGIDVHGTYRRLGLHPSYIDSVRSEYNTISNRITSWEFCAACSCLLLHRFLQSTWLSLSSPGCFLFLLERFSHLFVWWLSTSSGRNLFWAPIVHNYAKCSKIDWMLHNMHVAYLIYCASYYGCRSSLAAYACVFSFCRFS